MTAKKTKSFWDDFKQGLNQSTRWRWVWILWLLQLLVVSVVLYRCCSNT